MVDEYHLDSEPEKIPYPKLDEWNMRALDILLAHFENVAFRTVKRMSTIPRKSRPEWYEKNISYWKHAKAAYTFAREKNQRSLDKYGPESECSTETVDTTI